MRNLSKKTPRSKTYVNVVDGGLSRWLSVEDGLGKGLGIGGKSPVGEKSSSPITNLLLFRRRRSCRGNILILYFIPPIYLTINHQ